MQKSSLNLIGVLQHAAKAHAAVEVVTKSVEGDLHRTNYASLYRRTGQLANVLTKLGVESGDRIGTMAWNTWRHLECWYAIGGIGAICHTLNPRLFADQLDYIVNHAEDRFIFIDSTFVPVLAAVMDRLPTVEALIVLTDAAHMPDTSNISCNVYCYEDLIKSEPSHF
jgi:3-(methylthio)propionyl---CoA ligase